METWECTSGRVYVGQSSDSIARALRWFLTQLNNARLEFVATVESNCGANRWLFEELDSRWKKRSS